MIKQCVGRWRVGTKSNWNGMIFIDRDMGQDGNGDCIGSCYSVEMAQFIVDACNAHQDAGFYPPVRVKEK